MAIWPRQPGGQLLSHESVCWGPGEEGSAIQWFSVSTVKSPGGCCLNTPVTERQRQWWASLGTLRTNHMLNWASAGPALDPPGHLWARARTQGEWEKVDSWASCLWPSGPRCVHSPCIQNHTDHLKVLLKRQRSLTHPCSSHPWITERVAHLLCRQTTPPSLCPHLKRRSHTLGFKAVLQRQQL